MYYHTFLSLPLVISPYLLNGAPTSDSALLSVDDALYTYYCNDSPTWSGPSFFPRDCATALARFSVGELLVRGDAVFEFLAVDDHARSRYPSQRTPRKYMYGKFPVQIRQTYGREMPEFIFCKYP